MKAKRRAAGVAKVLAGAVLLVVALFPIYWLVAMSIRETGEMQGQIPLLEFFNGQQNFFLFLSCRYGIFSDPFHPVCGRPSLPFPDGKSSRLP